MKHNPALEALYHGVLQDSLQTLEPVRRKILRNYLIALLGTILVLVSLILYLSNVEQVKAPVPVTIGAVFIGCLVLFIMAATAQKHYRLLFKNTVVSEVVKAVNPDWQYDPDRRISSEDYRKSGIFTQPYDKYEGDDYFSGLIDKTDFECSELHTQFVRHSRDKDGRRKDHWHTIFKGLFLHADFNKQFLGQTFVSPDYTEKLFGKWGQKLQKFSGHGALVKLENPDFEKAFKVHSTDQIEARYILTPAIMEALLRIRNEYKRPVNFSFVDSRIYCALSFNKNLFEPKIIRSGLRFNDIATMYHLFKLNETIITELNLNTRIWTKQ